MEAGFINGVRSMRRERERQSVAPPAVAVNELQALQLRRQRLLVNPIGGACWLTRSVNNSYSLAPGEGEARIQWNGWAHSTESPHTFVKCSSAPDAHTVGKTRMGIASDARMPTAMTSSYTPPHVTHTNVCHAQHGAAAVGAHVLQPPPLSDD